MTGDAVTPVGAWPPPRQLPSCYPGLVPADHYVLVDEAVHPMQFVGTTARYLLVDGSWRNVDALLLERRLPLMAERCGVASYGANRNPGTLAVKMDHYRYRSPGQGRVLPVIRACLKAAEALAAGLSAQGYFFADLELGDPAIVADELTVWVNLVDSDQLRVLHDSERVGSWYRAVVLPEVIVEQLEGPIRPLAYVTDASALIPPGHASPVAFTTVDAKGRRVPAMEPVELWDTVLDGWDLRELVERLTGIPRSADQSANLMKYLNGQWWYRHNTGDTPLAGAVEVIAAVEEHIANESRPLSTLGRLQALGAVLDTEAAYAAGAEHGIGPAAGRWP